ncbi:hypothetical protein TRIP_B330386 [uncultured Desulfatiglans sp.]|uniref:Uncharacterized protein n=1 Tax=Uncultured Desulfatiglans sp. TaxID=1748965 RepID=A0A653A827_UNCDX|nr:hypothetical protein TRIP_B330386 [uncultured Desulfatiglans sp.]
MVLLLFVLLLYLLIPKCLLGDLLADGL